MSSIEVRIRKWQFYNDMLKHNYSFFIKYDNEYIKFWLKLCVLAECLLYVFSFETFNNKSNDYDFYTYEQKMQVIHLCLVLSDIVMF